jgi:hypothetical protein
MKKLPNWIAPVLRIAGILQIFTAAGLVLFSDALLASLQADIPLIPPADWWIQLSGLVLLVAGAGSFIGSYNPSRNSASLFMGFMSHLLLIAFLLGQLGTSNFSSAPLGAGLFLMLAWMLLEGFILYQISRARQNSQTLTHSYSEPLAKTLSRFRTHRGKNLLQLSNRQPVLLVFLRQLPFCQEALADIQRKKAMIEGEGTRLVFVHLGEEAEAQDYFERAGLREEHRISDPNGIMYNAFGLERASFNPETGWRIWLQRIAAILPGRGTGVIIGSSPKMPGVFLINQGEIVKSYRQGQAAKRPDYVSLATCEAA